MNQEKIGKFIAELRKEKGLSQYKLADMLYINRESVSKWERGVNIPEVSSLMLLSQIFNVSVNEILAGERITEENKEEVDGITLKILTYTKSKINRIKLLTIGITLLLLIIFFIVYFIYNYNSLKVYVVHTTTGDFDLSQGIIVTSKQKSYISLGSLVNNTDETIDYIELYYKYNNERRKLLITNNINSLNIDIHEYNEFVKVESISHIISNLYLDVVTDQDTHTIKLDSYLDYSNCYIIPFIFKNNTGDIEHSKTSNLPAIIENKFMYEDEKYKYSYEYKGSLYDCTYDVNGVIDIDIRDEDVNTIFYDILNEELSIINLTESVQYSYRENKCLTENCNEYNDIIISFEDNVLE